MRIITTHPRARGGYTNCNCPYTFMKIPGHVYAYIYIHYNNIYVDILPVRNFTMPPKGTKGRRPGNPAVENNNGPKIDPSSASPASGNELSPQPLSPKSGISEGNESDGSDFNEGDSLKMLKKILINQKVAEKKSDERFAKLNKAIKDSKKSLDSYKTTNDKAVEAIKSSTDQTAKDLLDLKSKVNDLQSNLDTTQSKLDRAQKMLDETVQDLKSKAKTIDKLEKKYEKDEEDLKRCLLLIDGVNERDHKKPIAVVQALLSDLGVPYKEGDVKAAYRIGTLKTGVSRPRTIKIQFSNTALKGGIFKNISKQIIGRVCISTMPFPQGSSNRLSRIRKYLTKQASILIFKTMILSLIEYGDIIYAGTSDLNLRKVVNLFYRSLRICDNNNNKISKKNTM